MNRVLKNEIRPSKRFPERSHNRSKERSPERFPERLHNRSRERSLVDYSSFYVRNDALTFTVMFAANIVRQTTPTLTKGPGRA